PDDTEDNNKDNNNEETKPSESEQPPEPKPKKDELSDENKKILKDNADTIAKNNEIAEKQEQEREKLKEAVKNGDTEAAEKIKQDMPKQEQLQNLKMKVEVQNNEKPKLRMPSAPSAGNGAK
ncbi:MAG: hypothetical protein LBD50_02185, partial [Rickettsiales bacterium]|nr:hypothetical protein [Rickettsiales bacterium]